MKKTVRILLTTILLYAMLSALALPALAEDNVVGGTWGDLTWTLNKNTGELLISGEGKMKDFSYNSTSTWLAYTSEIKTLTIESGVTSIGSYAFSECSSVTSITIPDSVTSIGFCAFYGCSSLTSITIPDSVTSIDDRAFAYCSSLTSIAIPERVTRIGASVFNWCDRLEKIYFAGTEDQWNELQVKLPSGVTVFFEHGKGHNWENGVCTICGERVPYGATVILPIVPETSSVGSKDASKSSTGGCKGAVSGKLTVMLLAMAGLACVVTLKKKKR